MIRLGQKVRDRISGLEGIAVARAEWLYGCSRVVVQAPVNKDHEIPDGQWVDEPQLEVIAPSELPEQTKEQRRAGGPVSVAPTRTSVPTR